LHLPPTATLFPYTTLFRSECAPHQAGPAYKTTATTPIPPSGIRSLANFLPSASAPHYTAAPGNKAAGSSLAPPGSTCKTGDFPFPTHAARLGCAAPTIGRSEER